MIGDEKFQAAVALVLEREGLLSDDKADPGGLTKYGISKAAYPDLDIAALTKDDAIGIYYRDYWLRCICPSLPWHMALPIFDAAVQHGAVTAVILAQRVADTTEDGKLGPATFKALSKLSPQDFVAHYQAERTLHYARQKAWERFGRGWMRRAFLTALATLNGV